MKKVLTVLLLLLIALNAFAYVTLRHFVQFSDTLTGICEKYNVDSSLIMDWNPDIVPDKLNIGEVIKVPYPVGYRYQVNSGDTLSDIANYFFADVKSIAVANDLEAPYRIRAGEFLFVPEYCIGETFNVVPGKCQWPTYGVITSPYGYRTHPVTGARESFHTGLDIARDAPAIKENTPFGAPIFAAESGVVNFAGENGGYGNLIEIKGTKNIYRYGHLTRFDVYEGQYVEKGQIIARIGNTGRSTGQHLHFEVRNLANDKTYDPMDFLPPVTAMKK